MALIDRRIALLIVALALANTATSDCTNDAGTGDLAEGEACAADGYVDATDGGCDSVPPVFFSLSAADFAGMAPWASAGRHRPMTSREANTATRTGT